MGTGGDMYSLIGIAFTYGVLLLIEVIVLLWRRKPLRMLWRLLLIGISFVVSIAAFVLAYAASRHPNSISCISGPPLAHPISTRLIEASCRAYYFFSAAMTVTYLLGSILIAAGIIILFAGRGHQTR